MVVPKEIAGLYNMVIPNVYSGVPNDVYHSVEGYSHSDLVRVSSSIKEYLLSKMNPPKPTDAMIKGSAFHDLCLLPDYYKETYLVSSTKGKTTKAYKELVEDNPDKVILTAQQADDIHYMRDALYDNPAIREVLESDTILRESSIWSVHPETGLTCKIRPDIINGGVIADLKSSGGGAHARNFLSSVYKWKYFVQAPYYMDVATWAGMSITDFQFFVVESKPPYLTAIYNLNTDLLNEGRCIYWAALLRMDEYLNGEDRWDGIEHGREVVTL